jgi:hypothetical protein
MNTDFKTRKDIAKELNMHPITLYRKLKELNIQLPPGLLSPHWQKIIFDVLTTGKSPLYLPSE